MELYIYSIPEEIGWALVGFLSCACVVMAVKVAKTFVEMWRESKMNKDEEEIV